MLNRVQKLDWLIASSPTLNDMILCWPHPVNWTVTHPSFVAFVGGPAKMWLVQCQSRRRSSGDHYAVESIVKRTIGEW